jgi:hypothetical protein
MAFILWGGLPSHAGQVGIFSDITPWAGFGRHVGTNPDPQRFVGINPDLPTDRRAKVRFFAVLPIGLAHNARFS